MTPLQRGIITSVLIAWAFPIAIRAQPAPTTAPYVDPSQLNVPWGQHDHYKQPWRAWMETRSGYDFARGVGVVYNYNDDPNLSCRLLAESGFKAFRIELGWGAMKWDEDSYVNVERTSALLQQCRKYGIRPTILLNAHHGGPCPLQWSERKLAAPAKEGDRVVRLVDAQNLIAGRSGISNLTTFRAAEAIITRIDPATGDCTLSIPLPKDLPADKPVHVATFKYLPLYPIGTPEFDETSAGWLRYVERICSILREAGIDDYDLEIWNELYFGSDFLDINNYYDPPLTPAPPDAFKPGGQCWELARRTVGHVKRVAPNARLIWGFSNMPLQFMTPDQLPAGMDGQSFHPYGTGTGNLKTDEQDPDQPNSRAGPPPPDFNVRLPEGWPALFLHTESLMRMLNPTARQVRPKLSPRFYRYVTEHGVMPGETDVTTEPAAWRFKSKSVLRGFCFYLNKGVDVMHWYSAFAPKWDEFGLLPPDLPKRPANATFDDLATPPMRAMRNLTRSFAGAEPLKKLSPLQLQIAERTPPRKVFEGAVDPSPAGSPIAGSSPAGASPLWEREVFAFLPFQLTARRFVIPVYLMTYDVTQEHPGATYRLSITGLPAESTAVTLYDPLTDQTTQVKTVRRGGVLEADVDVVDYPRLLKIE